MRRTPREHFAELMGRPEEACPLAEAACWIAAEAQSGTDVARTLAELDSMAEQAVARGVGIGRTRERVVSLNRYLFQEQGFHGNRDDYYDPRNSFLPDVLTRRAGIPITLCLVYMEVGRRAGLPVEGVGLPGHFLARVPLGRVPPGRVPEDPELLIDAFEGRIASEADCAERLRSLYGEDVRFDRRLLRTATAHEVLARMLGNLKQIHLGRSDWERALVYSDWSLLVWPDSPSELRDRGTLYARLDCPAAAARDLERFLALAPDDAAAPAVRRALEPLRRQAQRLH
jgi:regulator of sirC expression with transglutaminase-like and TPR domain